MGPTETEPHPAPDGYAETAYRADAIPEQSYALHNEMPLFLSEVRPRASIRSADVNPSPLTITP
ncbi:hypothetical protein [Halomonas sp. H5]|uniref:hypothetical protein n=1 Tax=Halomonas sp. H5 TaxID=3423910 RepID=UPI003D3668A1